MYWPPEEYKTNVDTARLEYGQLMSMANGGDSPQICSLKPLELHDGSAYLLRGMQGVEFQGMYMNQDIIVYGLPGTYPDDAFRSLELALLSLHRDIDLPAYIRKGLPPVKPSEWWPEGVLLQSLHKSD